MKACPACNTRYEDHFTFCTKDGTPVVQDLAAPAAQTGQGMIGQVIDGRYRIVQKLGEGGMGEVYVVEHVHIEKRFALKLLRAEILGNQEAVTRFRQEARSASSIGHENIVGIDDFGELPDRRVYMAMEYLVGAPLNDILQKGPIDLGRGLDIMISTCRGLAAAHAKGIVHRDMKPENIFVTQRDGRDVPKILDFGIAKVSQGDQVQNLTQAGSIYGTPFYMAPEQAMGAKMDHRVDVYAMGIILYEMFAGTLPFKGETFMGILSQHITMAAPPPSQVAPQNGRSCPLALEQVILRAIAKDPAQRYQSMNELAMALTEVYRQLVGPRTTGPMAPAPIGTAQFQAYGAGSSSNVPVGAVTQAIGRRRNAKVIVGVIVGVAALGGGGAAWYFTAGPGATQAEAKAQDPRKPPEEGPTSSTIAVKPVASTPASSAAASQAQAQAQPQKEIVAAATPDAGGAGLAQQAIVTPPLTNPVHSDKKIDKIVTPPAAKTVVVLVDSVPRGASVSMGSQRLGETPTQVTLKETETATFVFKMNGFKDATASWSSAKGTKVRGTLEKVHGDDEGELKKFPTTPTKSVPDDDDGLAVPKGMKK